MLKFSSLVIIILLIAFNIKCFAQSRIRIDSNTTVSITGNDSIFIDERLDKKNILIASAEFYYRENFNEFLRSNLRYPSEAIKNRIEGMVTVYAQVNSAGKLDSIKLGHSLHPLMDAEALRIVKTMTNWEPANDIPIVFIIPFKL